MLILLHRCILTFSILSPKNHDTGTCQMKEIIGILTQNNELLDSLRTYYPEDRITIYRNIDSIRKEEHNLLLVDSEIFDTVDSIQFFLSRVRKKVQDTPVLFVHKVSRVNEIMPDWFFNDFILYPFRKGELIVRIQRLLSESGEEDDSITIGPFRINLKEYSVYLKNEKLDLTYKEFEILRLLAQNPGTVFSRKELLNIIWGMEYIGGTRTVDVHIRRIRIKLGNEFNSIIETIRNVGYRCKE